MAPVPWSTSHRLDIHYAVALKAHVLRLPVDAVVGGGGAYEIVRKTIANRLASDVANDVAQLMKALFSASDSITGYTLYRHVGALIFEPVEAGSLAVAGTHAGSAAVGWQSTITFRDLPYHVFKIALLETAYGDLLHLAYPTTDVPFDAFIASCLPAAAGSNSIWEAVSSRGDNAIHSVKFLTISPNRRVRRSRNLA